MVKIKCQACGYEFECDPAKDPSCLCPRCYTPNPPQVKTPTPAPPPPSAGKYAVIYAILKDGSRSKVGEVREGGPEIILGRADLASYAWRDPETVSRVHVKIKFVNGKILIRDDGSTNGTYVDGSDIRGKGDVEITPGKEIILVNPTSPVVKLVIEVV